MTNREFAVVEPDSGYFRTVHAPGPVSVIESPAGCAAPIAAMVVTDSDDGERGELIAEREPRGWVLR